MNKTDKRFFTKGEPISLAALCNKLNRQALVHNGSQWVELTDDAVFNHIIEDVSSLVSGSQTHLSHYSTSSLKDDLRNSKTQFCLIEEKNIDIAPTDMILVVSENPELDFANACYLLYPQQTYCHVESHYISEHANIAASAKIGHNVHIEAGVVIKENANIGDNVYIGPNTVIYHGVVIGENSKIGATAVISHALIGKNVVIGHGTVIGKEGFGFATKHGVHHKIPQLGRAIIEDNVEIGAQSVIDRGALDDTVIKQGAKIGDLVDIAHNCSVGQGSFIVSQTGFAGSTNIGQYCAIGGQVGISDHLNIGSFVKIAAHSGVMRDIPDNENQAGFPAVPVKMWHKQNAILKKLINRKRTS